MSKAIPLMQCTAFLHINLNGQVITKPAADRQQVQLLLRESLQIIASESIEANRFSSLEIKITRHAIKEEIDEFLAGIDMRYVIQQTEPDTPETIAALAKANDPQWMEYMSINSAKTAESYTPEALARLRNYISTTYPEIPLRW